MMKFQDHPADPADYLPERPTRAELAQEEYEEHQIETYEDRFLSFCVAHYLDPEDTRSVLVYETVGEEERER